MELYTRLNCCLCYVKQNYSSWFDEYIWIYNTLFYKNIVFQPRLDIFIFLPILGWKYSSEYSKIIEYEISIQ